MASRNFFLSVSERTSDERSSDHDECPGASPGRSTAAVRARPLGGEHPSHIPAVAGSGVGDVGPDDVAVTELPVGPGVIARRTHSEVAYLDGDG